MNDSYRRCSKTTSEILTCLLLGSTSLVLAEFIGASQTVYFSISSGGSSPSWRLSTSTPQMPGGSSGGFMSQFFLPSSRRRYGDLQW